MGEPPIAQRFAKILKRLHWMRGLRAGLAVASAMLVCHVFRDSIGWAAGWAALGGFEAILVDNGGPYRSRFITISTLLLGGSLACVAGALSYAGTPETAVLLSVLVTAAFCFLITFGRVVAQPVASTSVIILVIYFAAWGSGTHSLRLALAHAAAFALGGVWAAVLSLVLWPVDPFRPARTAVSRCYEQLAEFTARIAPTERGSGERELARSRAFGLQRRLRAQMELARTALTVTAARAPSRTVRARNLTVLLETVDMLLVVTMRMTELALGIEATGTSEISRREVDSLREFTRWLSEAEESIAAGLQRRPAAEVSGCPPRRPAEAERVAREEDSTKLETGARALLVHLAAAEVDGWDNVQIACEAIDAVWSGIEVRSIRLNAAMRAALRSQGDSAPKPPVNVWMDAIRANWTVDSVMMRHALRMTMVGAADVLLLRVLHLSHGFWLGMTSIIVLQPYPSHTLKRSVERVGGTIAGGILAAVLAAAIPSQIGIVAVVTATSVLTLATYSVDYAWYGFFLTPTFVLLSLPHLRDWKYSGVRMLTTLLGALVSVAAMRALWPEREHLALGKLLARAADADAAYLRATLRYWDVLRVNSAKSDAARLEQRRLAEREVLAPARRAGGLASNDAEESLDRLMQEPGLASLVGSSRSRDVSNLAQDHALTFVTYLRRLRQSATTLAVVAKWDAAIVSELRQFAGRLDAVGAGLRSGGMYLPTDSVAAEGAPEGDGGPDSEMESDIALHQLRRMRRQVGILERAAVGLLEADSAHGDVAAELLSSDSAQVNH